MGELVPFLVGCVIGAVLMRLPRKGRAAYAVVACIAAGAVGSAINGELATGAWPAFISFDSALAWLGLAASVASYSLRRRFSDAT